MNLKDKVAIVTGGGIRVGRAIVLALAVRGCNVLIHYGRSDDEAKQTQRDAQALGVQAEIFSADLAQADAAQQVVDEAVRVFGRIDILINSAAIFPENDTFINSDADRFDKLMAVNLRAPYLLSRAFSKAVGDEQQGKIVNITDARIFIPNTDHFVYRFTKLSLKAFTEMAALELAPNVTVNAVALGAILPPPGKDDSYLQDIANKRVPLNRPGSTEIVAENVVHLLQQDFITGVTIKLDGGEFLN